MGGRFILKKINGYYHRENLMEKSEIPLEYLPVGRVLIRQGKAKAIITWPSKNKECDRCPGEHDKVVRFWIASRIVGQQCFDCYRGEK